MPTRYADVAAVAHDVGPLQLPRRRGARRRRRVEGMPDIGLPPIDADPPYHTWARRLILPWFSHQRVDGYEPMTRALCDELIDRVIDTGARRRRPGLRPADPGAGDLVDARRARRARRHVHGLGARRARVRARPRAQRAGLERDRRVLPDGRSRSAATNLGDDLVSDLLRAEVDGAPVPDVHVLGTLALILVAGVDTTWSSIGSAMWHLATHDDDRRRLVAEPELIPTAIEELLRAYSPVTMARIAVDDIELAGCPIQRRRQGAAELPRRQPRPGGVRAAPTRSSSTAQINRHVAFGVGIHRCAGSNLARMELQVAVEQWLQRIPEFRLVEGAEVTWAGGQVRGPRRIPVEF